MTQRPMTRMMKVGQWVIKHGRPGYNVGKIVDIYPRTRDCARMAMVEWNGITTCFHRTRDLRRVPTTYLP